MSLHCYLETKLHMHMHVCLCVCVCVYLYRLYVCCMCSTRQHFNILRYLFDNTYVCISYREFFNIDTSCFNIYCTYVRIYRLYVTHEVYNLDMSTSL